MNRVLMAVVFAGLALGGTASAQVPENERTLVTDAGMLRAMGFPANAQNVYIHTNLVQNIVPDDSSAQDFGAGSHFTPVPAKSFIGRENTGAAPWQYNGGTVGCCLNLSRLGVESYADAPIELPTGVNIAAIRYWAHDANAASNLNFFVFEACQPVSAGGATTLTTISSGSTSGSGGYQGGVLTGAGVTVNNSNCSYIARLSFGSTTDLTFQKLRVQWNRQVTPAPAFATFSDVPTSHPFHRFVQALVASGVTGGCGPGLYCPDSPVTRGQMAVFLSVALGLYWP